MGRKYGQRYRFATHMTKVFVRRTFAVYTTHKKRKLFLNHGMNISIGSTQFHYHWHKKAGELGGW